jgi:uncharacterized protein (TIGR02145 family)
MAYYFLSHLIGCSFVPITNLKNHKMMLRILPFLMLPLLGLSQTNSKVEIPNVGNTTGEKQALEIRRNAFYNLEEIKVRWKKAALENCLGVPCPTFSAPGPCSSIVATPSGPSSASISFVPPTSDGGSPITGYTVTATSTPSAPAKRKTTAAIITVSGTSSPIVVTGLILGVNYIFTVFAKNDVGPSTTITTVTTVAPCVLNTASAGSASPTLAVNTVLTNIIHSTTLATGIGTATGLPSGVTASWSANVITISGTPTAVGSFSYEIPLTGGCGSVKAMGTITVTPAPAATVPGAPTSVAATAGNATASVAFVAPTSNGGSVITGYTVTSSPAGGISTGASSPLTVTGLTNGTAYTFTVVATNAVGSSAASAASSAVTPAPAATVPGAPTSVAATAGNATASVAFVVPSSNGGSVITGYTVTSSPAGGISTGASSPLTVTGLTNGTAYTFTVVATNAVGSSVASAASSAVTPAPAATVPGAPTRVAATGGNATASVFFVAPTSNGGSVITGYTVTSSPADGIATGASSPLTVTGLTNGTVYTFTMVATNAVGSSAASAATCAVTPAVSFTCGSSNVLDIDNNCYNTVSIGTQCWIKENLRVRRYNDGTEISFNNSGGSGGTTSETWSGLDYGAHTIYANDSLASPSNLVTYGYLYNWYAAKGIATAGSTTYKNVCPTGWHVPSFSDFNKLVKFIHSGADTSALYSTILSTSAGTMLKKNDALWTTNTGTNTSGFSALPGGYRASGGGGFTSIRDKAFFFGSAEFGDGFLSLWLDYASGIVDRREVDSFNGGSVRCLRD